ncbi:MAG: septum formation initiator family protein [Candidatus Syntrophosphaera sp.]|nr:septum formation initiator family protein [Candidatus Syntrophosphaera sp.]
MKRQEPKNKKLANLAFLAVLIFLLSWILLWGPNSFLKVMKNQRKNELNRAQTEALQAENDSIARQNARLKSDPDAAEEVAREEHGLIKPDEVVYRFKPAQADSLEAKKK